MNSLVTFNNHWQGYIGSKNHSNIIPFVKAERKSHLHIELEYQFW